MDYRDPYITKILIERGTCARQWGLAIPSRECKWIFGFLIFASGILASAYYTSARLDVPRFTCDECVAGMEWIEAYLEDPIFQVISYTQVAALLSYGFV